MCSKKSDWKNIISRVMRVTDSGLECALRNLWKRGAWGKVKEWLEKWTEGEWKEWRRNKGVVYMWISVHTEKSYIRSTKGTIIERAKTHLMKVRKIIKIWSEEGQKKIDDEEIMPIHYEIARRPSDWVLLPISGEVKDWKKVE